MIPTSKKGADIAINVIIIAAIALVILVVVLYIFSSKSSKFSEGISDCKLQQGQCMPEKQCNGPIVRNTNCEKKETDIPEICCVKL